MPKQAELSDGTPLWEEDYFLDNPNLHWLYVRTAYTHLKWLNRTIRKCGKFSGNFNMMATLDDLIKNRRNLVTTNAAYRDAQALLTAGVQYKELPGAKEEIESERRAFERANGVTIPREDDAGD